MLNSVGLTKSITPVVQQPPGIPVRQGKGWLAVALARGRLGRADTHFLCTFRLLDLHVYTKEVSTHFLYLNIKRT